MGSFTEFLESQAGQIEAYKSRAIQSRDEWTTALNDLRDRVRGWLAEDDPNGRLEINTRPVHLREIGIGSYEAPGLSIGLGLTEVRVEPVARTVTAPYSMTGIVYIPKAFGRVDLTNSVDRYMMFRTEKTTEGRWFIIKQDGYNWERLDRTTFESALQDLLE